MILQQERTESPAQAGVYGTLRRIDVHFLESKTRILGLIKPMCEFAAVPSCHYLLR